MKIANSNQLFNFHELSSNQIEELNIKPLLIVGCGHDNNNAHRVSRCKSIHEGVITIDIDFRIKPDFVIDMNKVGSTISLGNQFRKIVFDGYWPSFWNINVIQFLLKHLTKDGDIYASGNPETSCILTNEYIVDSHNADINREAAYKIARLGNIEFIKYIVENTSIIAEFCSPNDCYGDYLRFFLFIPFDKHGYEYATNPTNRGVI